MKKLSAAANVLHILAKIASVCIIVGGCIIIASAVLLFAFDNASMIAFTSLELGHFSFELAQSSPELVRCVFGYEIPPAIALLGYGWLVLRVIRRILEPMKNGQPFDTSVSAQMKKLCWLTVGGGVCYQLTSTAASLLLYKACDFSSLFLNENITHVNMNLELDLGFVVLALIWYMLSCVFRYGEELQQQSDETL